ncbi:MAG: radical SAM protein [Deltaproteobacteria bacterium]|nr:radical SAM protein [Deltaproteobacteria bacterium]
MDVAFVYPGYESLGVEMLSAALKQAGHRTKLIFEPALFDDPYIQLAPVNRWMSFRSSTLRRIEELRPDLVCFSVTSFLYRWGLETARAIKERTSVPIAFGGIHPTVEPLEVISHPEVDYVVRAEGEHTLVELVRALESGDTSADRLRQIPSLVFRDGSTPVSNPMRPLWSGLDELPAPDKQIYWEEHPLFRIGYNTFAQRGCPERCSFCYKTALRRVIDAPTYEWRRTPEHVVEEIERNRDEADIYFVRFVDDNFTTNPQWLREFATVYGSRLKIPFWTQVHPGAITPLTSQLLKESGCVDVQMGVQSLNEDVRAGFLKRSESIRRIERSLELLRDAGITVAVDHILSVPGQTDEDLRNTVRFYLDNPVARINVFWLAYLPGTDMTEEGIANGDIDPELARRIRTGEAAPSVLTGGHRFKKANARFQTLLILAGVLPASWTKFILKHRLERYLPYAGTILSTVATYWLSYKTKGARNDLYRVWTRIKYRDYTLRKLTGRTFRPEQVTWSEPPPADRPGIARAA